MKKIEIIAPQFFELLKERDTSMWEIFSGLMTGEPAEIQFLTAERQPLFSYVLPEAKEKLEEDRRLFAKEFSEKLSRQN